MNFCSDNATGAAPEVLAAVGRANAGPAMPYGDDPLTADICARIAEVFETECAVFLLATGSAANALALSQLVPPFGAVLCHPMSHVNTDECGGPELFTGGAKLVAIDGPDGKMALDDIAPVIRHAEAMGVHNTPPRALSLTNSNECGQVLTPDETAAYAKVAHAHGLKVHMDGARFANALAALDCAPADATWRAGVDVLSFGGTKNGCFAAEAVVFFDPALAREFGYRRKRAGHLWSKHRFIAAQFDGYLADGNWLRFARHANAMAARLVEGLSNIPGCALVRPAPANEIFFHMDKAVRDGLRAAGFQFYDWPHDGPDAVRLVTAFDTDPDHVDALVGKARDLAAQANAA